MVQGESAGALGGVLTACVILALSSGCAGSMQLAYTSPSPADTEQSATGLDIQDPRAPGKGGDDPYVVGVLSNAFGIPFAVKGHRRNRLRSGTSRKQSSVE
jgi:hypothetical protein